MTTRDDILTLITEGRLDAVRARATALSNTLAEVEAIVREMRPTSEAVTVQGGNTADLADAEDMRSLLMEQGQEPSAAGLAEFIRFARMGEDEKDKAIEALADLEAMRGILDGAGYSPTPTGLRGLLGLVGTLRARVAALTPGPWVRLGDTAPNIGETVLMWSGVQDTPPWMQVFYSTVIQPIAADYLWRRFPAGLLDAPDGDPAT